MTPTGERLAAITFLWLGWRAIYRAAHVNAWAVQIREHLPEVDRIICITDVPRGITECETYPLWEPPKVRMPSKRHPNCYLRLRLFDPDIGSRFGDRLFVMDLDSVVRQSLSPLITADDFRAMRGTCSPMNGSLWMLKVGTNEHVWRSFDPRAVPLITRSALHKGKPMIGSDQVWMSMTLPETSVWGPEAGLRQFASIRSDEDAEQARVVFFAGDTKPWSEACRERAPKLHALYRTYYQRGLDLKSTVKAAVGT